MIELVQDGAAKSAVWSRVRLGDYCEARIETIVPELNPDEEFTYVDISAVDAASKRIVAPRKLLGREASSRARQKLRSGDVIVSTVRPNLNAVAMVGPEWDGAVGSTGFCVLRAKAGLDAEFLFAWVRSREFVGGLSALVAGAMYPAVSDRQVREQFIPLPSLADQERIVQLLRGKFADFDRARKALADQLDAAEKLPGAHLREVFCSQGHIWKPVSLGQLLIETRNGLYKPDSFYGRGTPIVKMFNIGRLDGAWDLTRLDKLELSSEESALYTLREGDIVLNRVNSRELVGKCAVVGEAIAGAVFESKNMRLRLDVSRAEPSFVAWFLNGFLGRHQIECRIKQIAGMATLNRPDLDHFLVPLPGLALQREITTRQGAFSEHAIKIKRELSAQLAALDRYPAALLREAFAGRL